MTAIETKGNSVSAIESLTALRALEREDSLRDKDDASVSFDHKNKRRLVTNLESQVI